MTPTEAAHLSTQKSKKCMIWLQNQSLACNQVCPSAKCTYENSHAYYRQPVNNKEAQLQRAAQV